MKVLGFSPLLQNKNISAILTNILVGAHLIILNDLQGMSVKLLIVKRQSIILKKNLKVLSTKFCMQRLPPSMCGDFFMCFHSAGVLERMLYERCELQPCSTNPVPTSPALCPVRHLLCGAGVPPQLCGPVLPGAALL